MLFAIGSVTCSKIHDLNEDCFVSKVVDPKKLGKPDEVSSPFELSDGVDDSHVYLMDLIDEARDIPDKRRMCK